MKTCTVCKETKDLNEFGKMSRSPDGKYPQCKGCKSKKDKENYLENKEEIKESSKNRYHENKEEILDKRKNDPDIKEYNKKWKQDNKEHVSEYNKNYREDNKENIKEQRKKYRKKNRESLQKYENNKRKADPLFKIAKSIRNRLQDFIKNNGSVFRKRKTSEYLGCSFNDFKSHIEKQFLPEMNWENYGKWHLDHKIPLSLAKTEDQLYTLAHHTNIQPLWAIDNLTKNNKFDNKTCWQKQIRDLLLNEDIQKGFPTNLKIKDFTFSEEKLNDEHRKFIERYEWLGTCGFGVRYVFTARHNGYLGGVVLIAEPNAYQFDKKYEALIQRGACASWTPKNLGSKLITFACNWMVRNTDKRLFVAYSDPEAGEIGTIYQACNFDYLGNGFGSDHYYKLENNKLVNSRYFTRTSSMKKWCKTLNIEWKESWEKPNGFQNIKEIPEDIYKQLREYANKYMNSLPKIKKLSKGKYILLLNYGKTKIKKSWERLPYPKRT